ncbi:MAG: hypothetical protein JWM04_2258 [Verrucomicrobiales bacterium]|nr:hypothetical protein [Verrucomicrobiales bacterium]
MKFWSENIRFKIPLKGVELTRFQSLDEEKEQYWKEQVRMSYERGRMEGETTWSELLIQQRKEVQVLQDGVLKSVRDVIPSITSACEETLVQLAFEIAKKLVADLPISGDMVRATVLDALHEVDRNTEFTVHIHPEDLKIMEHFACGSMELTGMKMQADSGITRGGCVVKTDFGIIDATRETKLDKLRAAMVA